MRIVNRKGKIVHHIAEHDFFLFTKGCIQSLDWTSGLDWWTGLLDSDFFLFVFHFSTYLGNWS